MGYLLDTCVVSDFVKAEKQTLTRLKATAPRDVYLSAVTLMEIKYGLAINPEKAVKIQDIIQELVSSVTIIPFGREEAEQAAQVRSLLKQAGTPIGAYDLLIAATALQHQLIAVTANVREFERVPRLRVENWRGDR